MTVITRVECFLYLAFIHSRENCPVEGREVAEREVAEREVVLFVGWLGLSSPVLSNSRNYKYKKLYIPTYPVCDVSLTNKYARVLASRGILPTS